jgi:hypothetical protein
MNYETPAALAVVVLMTDGLFAQPSRSATDPRPPDGQPPRDQACTISPEAAAAIKKVADAHEAQELDLVGKLTGKLDIGGQKKDEKGGVHQLFAALNSFRHEIKDEELVGSTGEKLYVYGKGTNMYLMVDAPKTKSSARISPIRSIIGGQNLSLVSRSRAIHRPS